MVVVIQNVFPLLPPDRYLLPLTTLNRYHPRDSNGHFIFMTTSRNVLPDTYAYYLNSMNSMDLVIII